MIAYLLERPDEKVAVLVEHDDGHAHVAKLADARARRGGINRVSVSQSANRRFGALLFFFFPSIPFSLSFLFFSFPFPLVVRGKKKEEKRKRERKKHSQLPTHAARAGGRRDVGRDGDGAEGAVAVGDGAPERDPLRARRDRVAGVLDVGAGHQVAARRQQRRAHAEPAVGAVGGRLGGAGAVAQRAKLGRREAVGGAGGGDVALGGGGREEGGHVFFCLLCFALLCLPCLLVFLYM